MLTERQVCGFRKYSFPVLKFFAIKANSVHQLCGIFIDLQQR